MLTQHGSATLEKLPFFITPPGQTDILFVTMLFVLVGAIAAVGVFYFWLHSLPERMVHNKLQYDIVAALALLSLFTHMHAFWVAALVLAFIEIPEFRLHQYSTSAERIASSLERIANQKTPKGEPASLPQHKAT